MCTSYIPMTIIFIYLHQFSYTKNRYDYYDILNKVKRFLSNQKVKNEYGQLKAQNG